MTVKGLTTAQSRALRVWEDGKLHGYVDNKVRIDTFYTLVWLGLVKAHAGRKGRITKAGRLHILWEKAHDRTN